jgi:HSP20 family protein
MLEMRRSGLWAAPQLREEIDRAFGGQLNGGWLPDWSEYLGGSAIPAMNLWEEKDAVVLEMEVPGLGMEDFDVLVVGNEITVKGARKEVADEGTVYHLRERTAGSFSRTVRAPVDVDAEKVQAGLKDGILTITIPKIESAKPRKIQVKGV